MPKLFPLENIKGKLIKSLYKEKNSNSSMLPWETIISLTNSSLVNTCFPPTFFFYLLFSNSDSDTKRRSSICATLFYKNGISSVHLDVFYKVIACSLIFPLQSIDFNTHFTQAISQLVNDQPWSINWDYMCLRVLISHYAAPSSIHGKRNNPESN